MKDLINFAAYAALGSCIAVVVAGASVAIGGKEIYMALILDPARFLSWAAITGGIGGFAFRLTKD